LFLEYDELELDANTSQQSGGSHNRDNLSRFMPEPQKLVHAFMKRKLPDPQEQEFTQR
jgi:hypothetical protein